MPTAAVENEQTLALFHRIDALEDVAERAADGDRQLLLQVVRNELDASPPVRPSAAAEILNLSERTVRTWVAEGVLQPAVTTPRLLIDTNALHAVAGILKQVREAGKTRALLDEVYRRLVDSTWLERDDLTESLDELRRGDVTVRISKAD